MSLTMSAHGVAFRSKHEIRTGGWELMRRWEDMQSYMLLLLLEVSGATRSFPLIGANNPWCMGCRWSFQWETDG